MSIHLIFLLLSSRFAAGRGGSWAVSRSRRSSLQYAGTELTSSYLTVNLNLLSVGSQPSPLFDPLVYPIPLPQTEEDFTFGVASSKETWRDVKDGRCSNPASFLTSLLHISAIWGDTARALAAQSTPDPPWHPDSLYETTSKAMRGWLAKLGERNKWSVSNLLAYKSRGLDLVSLLRFA